MFRFKLLIAAVVAAVVTAALAPVALAGGWSIVTSPDFPSEAIAGQEFTIDFTVLQHGVTPMNDLTPLVKLTGASGETRVFAATGEGGEGHYVARVVLDQPGTWQCVIEAFEGDHTMPALRVQPAAARPAAGGVAVESTTNEATMPVAGNADRQSMTTGATTFAAQESMPWLFVAAVGLLAVSVVTIVVIARPRWRGNSRHIA